MRIYGQKNKRSFIKILCLVLALCTVLAGCRKRADGGPASSATLSVSAEVSSGTDASPGISSGAETSAGVPSGTETPSGAQASSGDDTGASVTVTEDGAYITKEDVALYLHTYGRLPSNFITKNEARNLGWEAEKGNLQKVAPGMSIGGDRFGNREGLLPDEKGRTYYECDINYTGGRRGAERIVYSNDGLIFYTGDHYASYEQLYP